MFFVIVFIFKFDYIFIYSPENSKIILTPIREVLDIISKN